MTDFGTLQVHEVIMHRIPSGRRVEGAAETIEFSEATVDILDASAMQTKVFLEMRLRSALGSHARPVVEDTELMSACPDFIRGLLLESGDLVADSSEMARLLHGAQKWMSSVGLLMVVVGRVSDEKCVVVAKLEHQDGVRVQQAVTDGGLRTYRAEYLQDLVLSQGTKVFKAGIFSRSGAGTQGLMEGHVVDDQSGQGHVADYYVEFLGCRFLLRADVQTETFFNTAQRVIGRLAKGDPSRRADYEVALLVEMQSARSNVSPLDFAMSHLDEGHADEFLRRIQEAGLPRSSFRKDTSLIDASIRRMKVQTSRGATIFVPPQMHEDGSLRMEPIGDEGLSTITLIDEVTGITGAGGPKPREKSGTTGESET